MRICCFRLCSPAAFIAFSLLASDCPGQVYPLHDTTGLVARNVTLDAVEFQGRKAVRLTKDSDIEGFALLPGSDFQDGTIEADIAVKRIGPPGGRMPGFIGIAFRARPDASVYELIYIRPGNSTSEDQAMRNHSVQYSASPDFGWYRLRREWPSVYESHADLRWEQWIPLRIEVAGRTAKLYLNGAAQPSLVLDGMKGEDLHGGVALWGYPGEESYFSNIRIKKAAPQPIKNGTDAAGQWQVRLGTDAGGFGGSLQLKREGNQLTGMWSGDLGDHRPVHGVWRNGYVELSFEGTWTKEMGNGAPGNAPVSLAGWFDGAGGKGRMKMDGRADGQWMAVPKK